MQLFLTELPVAPVALNRSRNMMEMDEWFLHFIWQNQYFNATDLHTTDGTPLRVLHPGVRNTNAGPDFRNARLLADGLEWFGQVEIHVHSDDWNRHGHHQNPAYDAVILHVAWKAKGETFRTNGQPIPTLELYNRVPVQALKQYEILQKDAFSPLPACAGQLPDVPQIAVRSAWERALFSRLQRKAAIALEVADRNQYDWEETCWQLLAGSFGMKVNQEPFSMLARAVPLRLLRPLADQPLAVEALLFGQAGLLPSAHEHPHVQALIKEHRYLAHKYQLPTEGMPPATWQFMRMRPANFPTRRLAQLAALVTARPRWFGFLTSSPSANELLNFFAEATPSAFWETHYTFDRTSAPASTKVGRQTAISLLINTVAPLLTAYGQWKDEEKFIGEVAALLEALPPEDNQVSRMWKQTGVPIQNAFDSQAAIEQHQQMCQLKKCAQCPVGISIIRRKQK